MHDRLRPERSDLGRAVFPAASRQELHLVLLKGAELNRLSLAPKTGPVREKIKFGDYDPRYCRYRCEIPSQIAGGEWRTAEGLPICRH